MPDTPPGPESADIPQAVAKPARRGTLQLVWIIPIVAVLVGGWLALKAALERGPTITITLKSAEGIEAGKTRIKYKDVEMGTVSAIGLSEDRAAVVVTAELGKQAEALLVDDTRFWVVRPRVAGGQVSGLSTLVSGAFIGLDPGKSTDERRDFVALDGAPIVASDRPGRQFVLHADNLGSLDIGSPVYFRRVEVGQVVAFELDEQGKGVSLRVFVHAPYDQYVTVGTRFWNASGVDVALDASGMKVRTESLVSILLGGIAFQTPPEAPPARPAEPDVAFRLFPDRAEAFKLPDTAVETYLLVFDQSVRGLVVGAPVDFRGVIVGEVTRISLDFDAAQVEFRTAVEVQVYPERVRARVRGPRNDAPAIADQVSRLQRFVERGFRAQLRTGNLLTGQLYVALDFFPNTKKVKVDTASVPLEIPTIPGSFEELQTSFANVVKKLEKVPFDEIAADVRRAVLSLDRTLRDTDRLVRRLDAEIAPDLRATLEQARSALAGAERMLAADAPLQTDLRTALRDLSRASEAVRNLADYLERHPESLIRGKHGEEQP